MSVIASLLILASFQGPATVCLCLCLSSHINPRSLHPAETQTLTHFPRSQYHTSDRPSHTLSVQHNWAFTKPQKLQVGRHWSIPPLFYACGTPEPVLLRHRHGLANPDYTMTPLVSRSDIVQPMPKSIPEYLDHCFEPLIPLAWYSQIYSHHSNARTQIK